ncbi:MAG: FIST N-terminal domain-containing protein [Anaerolineales bacterium]|jgi:hypothetical protein
MPVKVAVGQAFSVEGREAVSNAVYNARLTLGNASIDFAVIIASLEYDFQAIFNAAQTQIGDVPMIGFSTSGELTQSGSHRRSVVVALLSDDQLVCASEWLPGFSDNSARVTREAISSLSLTSEQKGLLLLVADGLNGNYEEVVNNLPPGRYQLAGCLAGGDVRLGRTHQLGGNRSGAGGLAAAFLSGSNLKVGIGTAHGWKPVGATFDITKVHGPWVRSLDHKPAVEGYANLFGRQVREWSFPPLNTLVRLYPLGIERDGQPLLVRTPLRVEADGSLRMSVELQENDVGHLMVGSREKCVEAARLAAKTALENLGGALPKLALVMADVSWQILFQGYEGADIAAIREELGEEVMIAGGYTFGQFTHMAGAPRPEFLNQHIEIVLIGEG